MCLSGFPSPVLCHPSRTVDELPPCPPPVSFLPRVFIVLLVVVSILWIPIIQTSNSGQLFDYIQAITSYLAPPIAALFLMAVFWKRVNEQGAFWGLMVGLLIGTIRMVMEFAYGVPACGEEDRRPALLKDVHYLYFALILLFLTALVITVVSLCTPAIEEQHLVRLTWWTRHSQLPRVQLEDPWTLPVSSSSGPEKSANPEDKDGGQPQPEQEVKGETGEGGTCARIRVFVFPHVPPQLRTIPDPQAGLTTTSGVAQKPQDEETAEEAQYDSVENSETASAGVPFPFQVHFSF
ncbi:SC5A9 protein, partial [Polypterus senegalus]